MATHDDILDFDYEEHQEETQLKYASFWQRVGASLIDSLIFAPVAVLSIYNTISFKNFILFLLLSMVGLLYKPVMEYAYGASLGKMAMKLKVITESHGNMNVEQTIVRNIFYILIGVLSLLSGIYTFTSGDFENIGTFMELSEAQNQQTSAMITQIVNFVFLISCLFVAFRDNRQALHDSMASTYVIER
jgi:uncharacterized RDD family membrane protein YckC